MEKNIKISKLIFFIPARSGSTRLKNKNLKKFKQSSLLVNKIKSCQAAKFGDVIVSTDSNKIAKVAKRHRAKIINLRSKNLATSKSSMISSVIDLINNLEKKKINKPDYIAIVPLTCPLLKISTIKTICRKIITRKNFNSISSIYPSNIDPFNIIQLKNKIIFDTFKLANKKFSTFERSQDKPKFYKISSAIQISKTKYFERFKFKNLIKLMKKPIDVNSCIFHKISPIENFDINDGVDYKILIKLLPRYKLLKLISKKFY